MTTSVDAEVDSHLSGQSEKIDDFRIVKRNNRSYIVKKWSFKHRLFYRFMSPVLRSIVPTLFNFEIIGLENLLQIPGDKPIILASNHRSHLDSLLAFTAMFPPVGNRRYITTLTHSKALKQNFAFKMMGYLGAYPIIRHNSDQSLEYLLETLKADLTVGLFPQGGRRIRSPIEDYQLLAQEGKSGIGRLILRLDKDVPVIPVYMHGTAEALMSRTFKPKFGSYVSVTVGKPIYFSQYTNQEWDEKESDFIDTARDVTNTIMQSIQELCYETEKPIFDFLEKKFGKKIEDMVLSESQSTKLRRWLRHYSRHPPSDFNREN